MLVTLPKVSPIQPQPEAIKADVKIKLKRKNFFGFITLNDERGMLNDIFLSLSPVVHLTCHFCGRKSLRH